MWFKVDDQLHDHRKTRAAGKSAMGVWVLAGSWAASNETDGFIPVGVLARWGTRADAARLVAAGLWIDGERLGEPGWRFHDWFRFQPSAAVTAAKRAAEHEAGIRGNHQRWHVKRKLTDPECEYCYQVPDREPDGLPDEQPIGSGESGAISPLGAIPPVPEPDTSAKALARSNAEPTAQTLIAEWLEHCPERPPGQIVGQVSKHLKTMVAEGIAISHIRLGLAEWSRKALHPSVLASVVHEQQQKARTLSVVTDPSQLPPVEESWMRRRPK